jgi:hypothetical protein
MVRDLETAIRRFEASEVLQVHSIAVRWEKFEFFSRALRSASREFRQLRVGGDKGVVVRQLWSLYDALALTPIDPKTESLQGLQLLDRIKALDDGGTDSWADLCGATETLLSEEHPAKKVEDLFSENNLAPLLRSEKVAVVGSTKFSVDTRQQLELGNRDYELLTLRELRTGGMWDVVVLLGTQVSRFLHSQTPEQAAQEVAWLYSAPAAPNIVVITWSGGQRFDITQYNFRPEIQLPKVQEYGFGSMTQWGGLRRRNVKVLGGKSGDVDGFSFIIEGPEFAGDEASGVVTSGHEGEWVVPFAKAFQPRPRLLEMDDYGVAITPVEKPAKFPIGGILVVREDRSDFGAQSYDPERDEIRKVARAALRGKYDRYRAASEKFKSEMADAAKRDESLVRLKEVGFQHPLYYLRIHANPQYIGPGTHDIYKRLCVALRITENSDVYEAIESIRNAHRSAGFEVTSRILQRLETDRDWEESCRLEHFYILEDKTFGRVILAKVLAINEGLVDMSELGQRKFVHAEVSNHDKSVEVNED